MLDTLRLGNQTSKLAIIALKLPSFNIPEFSCPAPLHDPFPSFTASFSALPGLNARTVDACISSVSTV